VVTPLQSKALLASIKQLFDQFQERVTGDAPTLEDIHRRQILGRLRVLLGNRRSFGIEHATRLLKEADGQYRETGLWLHHNS
jgi:hypothetical protein